MTLKPWPYRLRFFVWALGRYDKHGLFVNILKRTILNNYL